MGWSHEEAKGHTVVERLLERCGAYNEDGLFCTFRSDLAHEDWCERCLAADLLIGLGVEG